MSSLRVPVQLVVAVFLCSTGMVSAEESCRPAVDVADSLDVNATTDCDYKETGLNRVVHKLFAKDSAKPAPSDSLPVNPRLADRPLQSVSQIESLFVADASALAAARYELLQNISSQCPHEFRLTDERYSSQGKTIKIKLSYECVED